MSKTRQAAAAAEALRSLQPGDHWIYDVTGALERPGTAAPLALSGTITVNVMPDTLLNGVDSMMLTFVQELQTREGAEPPEPFAGPALKFWFVQDPITKDAAIVADNMGQNGACRRAKAPQTFYPGRWFAGTHYDNRLNFAGDDFVHNTLAVTGQVVVETPLGVFSAWVAHITSESSAMGKITGIDWWTPDLGAPACFETKATMPDGTATLLRATLSHTNVLERARA